MAGAGFHTPRYLLERHELDVLAPALARFLPPRAAVEVLRYSEAWAVVAATTKGGRRLVLRTPIPPRMDPAEAWAARVAQGLFDAAARYDAAPVADLWAWPRCAPAAAAAAPGLAPEPEAPPPPAPAGHVAEAGKMVAANDASAPVLQLPPPAPLPAGPRCRVEFMLLPLAEAPRAGTAILAEAGWQDALAAAQLGAREARELRVCHDGRVLPMLADGEAELRRLPRNQAATACWHAYWRAAFRKADLARVSAIHGPALLLLATARLPAPTQENPRP